MLRLIHYLFATSVSQDEDASLAGGTSNKGIRIVKLCIIRHLMRDEHQDKVCLSGEVKSIHVSIVAKVTQQGHDPLERISVLKVKILDLFRLNLTALVVRLLKG